MSHTDIGNRYRELHAMAERGWSLKELQDLPPFELDFYLQLCRELDKARKDKARGLS